MPLWLGSWDPGNREVASWACTEPAPDSHFAFSHWKGSDKRVGTTALVFQTLSRYSCSMVNCFSLAKLMPVWIENLLFKNCVFFVFFKKRFQFPDFIPPGEIQIVKKAYFLPCCFFYFRFKHIGHCNCVQNSQNEEFVQRFYFFPRQNIDDHRPPEFSNFPWTLFSWAFRNARDTAIFFNEPTVSQFVFSNF